MCQCYGDVIDDVSANDCGSAVTDGCQTRHSVHVAAESRSPRVSVIMKKLMMSVLMTVAVV